MSRDRNPTIGTTFSPSRRLNHRGTHVSSTALQNLPNLSEATPVGHRSDGGGWRGKRNATPLAGHAVRQGNLLVHLGEWFPRGRASEAIIASILPQLPAAPLRSPGSSSANPFASRQCLRDRGSMRARTFAPSWPPPSIHPLNSSREGTGQ